MTTKTTSLSILLYQQAINSKTCRALLRYQIGNILWIIDYQLSQIYYSSVETHVCCHNFMLSCFHVRWRNQGSMKKSTIQMLYISSIILYTALLKKLYEAVTNVNIILIIGGYLQFDWTLSNPTKFKANINLWILSCNNMYIISVCRCVKQRNRNSVCKHKSFTFLGLGSKYRYKIIYWYTMRKERWLIKILKNG